MTNTYPRRRRNGGTKGALKTLSGTLPKRPSLELYGTIHTPKVYTPLLRPEGPYYGSGT